ncbi:DNA alkylation repair protein [Treponema sp. OMZ 838]|uniref:DNA alkylation repair protein n=1 Tax=unclassified Treponema TaxID=2638727 RepID=UPI0009E092F8
MEKMMESIQSKLLSMQDISYRDFNAKLIPTVDPKLMIGIRTPLLRKFAKDLFKMEPKQAAAFMQTLPHRYFEENNLHAFLIENIKDFDTAITETERFLPFIDNWATCDTFAPPLFKKHPDEIYQKILLWIRSHRTYTVRYAINLLLSNYLDDRFKPEMLELVASVKSDEYYINMMIAWYFSFALIKQYDAALPYIKKQTLAPFTHNKTIQKAIESRRISPEIKDYLRTLKV